jgi:hypothetical protein
MDLNKIIKVIKKGNAPTGRGGKPMDHCVSCCKQTTFNYNAITRNARLVVLTTNGESSHALWGFIG